MDMVWLSKGSRGSWISVFLVFPVSSFEPISKKTKNPDKAITRISNFSVARECKDPKELENNQKERGKEKEEKREGGPRAPWGPWAPWAPPLSFSLSLFLFLFDCFPILLDPCILLQPRNSKFE